MLPRQVRRPANEFSGWSDDNHDGNSHDAPLPAEALISAAGDEATVKQTGIADPGLRPLWASVSGIVRVTRSTVCGIGKGRAWSQGLSVSNTREFTSVTWLRWQVTEHANNFAVLLLAARDEVSHHFPGVKLVSLMLTDMVWDGTEWN